MRRPSRSRTWLWVLVVLGVIAVLAGMFALGRFVGSTSHAEKPAPSSTVTATPTVSPTEHSGAPATTPAKPGTTVGYENLAGGECLGKPFDGAWASSFTVVNCDTAHLAQVTARVSAGDAGAAYPGADAMRARAASVCDDPAQRSKDAITKYADLQMQAAYAANDAEWNAGDRTIACFASRPNGGEITGSVAP